MEGLGYGTRDQGLLFSLNAHLWTNSIPILHVRHPGTAREVPAGTVRRQPHRRQRGQRARRRVRHLQHADARRFATATATSSTARRRSSRTRRSPTSFVAYATIDPALGATGITGFIIERDTPGLTVWRKLHKMGLRTSPMAEVIFEDCRVPVAQRLGREGRGVEVFECSMEWERGCILASCLGVMRRQLEACIDHARAAQAVRPPDRQVSVGRQPHRGHEGPARDVPPLVYRIGELKDRNRPAMLEAAMAKLHVSQCFVQSSLDAIQIFGGYGYMTEQQVERDLRDAVGSSLYSGTSEIQRNIIAKALGL